MPTRAANLPPRSALLVGAFLVAGCAPPPAEDPSKPPPPEPSGTPAASATAKPPAKGPCAENFEILPSKDVAFSRPKTNAEAKPFPGSDVSFRAQAARDGDRLVVTGILRNDGATAQDVDYLTGGVAGLSTNPFDVQVTGAPPRQATGPEVYPAPGRATMPPGSSITFRITRCPSFPAQVTWSFQPFKGKPIAGKALVEGS